MPTKKKSPPKKAVPAKKAKPDKAEKIATAIMDALLPADAPAEDKGPSSKELKAEALERHKAARAEANGGKPPEQIEVWYDDFSKAYLYKLQGRLRTLGKADIKLHLQSIGLSDKVYFDGVTESDWPFLHALNHRFVDYAGSLPGHRVGLFKDASGRRILVTEEARGVYDEIVNFKKEPEFIPQFLSELLGEHDQWMHLCYSMSVGLTSLRAFDWRPAPCTFVIGKKDSGKSLLQYIVRQIFGGRVANPYLSMCAGAKFNGELMGGECWTMEDPHLEPHMNARLSFAAKIKEYFHNEEFTFHDKNKRAFTVPCWRRGFHSINDEHEDLTPLPPFRDGVSDKMTLYRCGRAEKSLKRFTAQKALPGFETTDGIDRKAIKATIEAELPAVRAWLLQAFQTVPAQWKDGRYGVAAFHHPALLTELADLSPEARFLTYVHEVLFRVEHGGAPRADWRQGPVAADFIECGSKELERRMMTSEYKTQVEKGIHLCGKNLGRLLLSHPQLISRRVLDGTTLWTIQNPFRPNKTN